MGNVQGTSLGQIDRENAFIINYLLGGFKKVAKRPKSSIRQMLRKWICMC